VTKRDICACAENQTPVIQSVVSHMLHAKSSWFTAVYGEALLYQDKPLCHRQTSVMSGCEDWYKQNYVFQLNVLPHSV
jgi:hypothetical protein